MSRIEKLKEKVDLLYQGKNPNRADWADWLHENHVFVVADKAKELAVRFNVNIELAEAAGMLHDIADVKMSRFDSAHEKQSEQIAQKLLEDSGFSKEEISIIVEDAIRYHSCHDGKIPNSLEGKVVATADAVAHLSSDFYLYSIEQIKKSMSEEDIKKWGLPKIERDFHDKIFFDEIREEVREDYEKAKTLFSSLVK